MKLLPVVLAGLAGAAGLLAASDPHRGSIALILDDAPVSAQIRSRAELDSPAAKQARENILSRQAAVRREAEARGFRVLTSVQVLANAVFVAGRPEDRRRLAGMEGVTRIHYLPPAKRHLNEAGRIVQAAQAWTSLGGQQNAGAGVKIAILDSGIDQTHPGLADPTMAMPAGYPRCAGDDCSYTSTKVIAARSYVRMLADGGSVNPEQYSAPDDYSARDRVGHGTGIAMIVAGRQVTTPGGTTLTGIAPRAYVGNYKVFGSPGLNDFAYLSTVVRALEDASLDGMDIATLSLGGPAIYAPLDEGATCWLSAGEPCDVRIAAIENAVKLGMLVVISAGNEGDNSSQFPGLSTLSTPGTAPSAITVGASRNAHIWRASVQLTGTDAPASLRDIPAEFGDGPKPGGPMDPFPLRDVSKIGDPEACSSLPAGSLNGAIALIARGTCFFFQKVNNAQAAGARGVVMYLEDGNETPFPATGLLQTSIPLMVIPHSSGIALRTFLESHPNRAVILDPTLKATNDPNADTMAAFSSRGPVIGNYALKPELVAPGTSILTATQNYDPNSDMFDSTRYVAVSGSSVAGPMVTGVAALVKQKNPGFSPAQIKSAVVNTATTIPGDSDALRVLSTGAGRLNAEAAVKTNVTVEPAVVSFGSLASPATFPPTEVQLKITAPANLALNARVEAVTPDSRAQIRLTSDRPDTVRVQLEGTRPTAGVYHGFIVITGGAVDLRVPYLYVVGDGVPHSTQHLGGDSFDLIARQPTCYDNQQLFRLVDRYGASVDLPDGTVVWRVVSGGGQLECPVGQACMADLGTDRYGVSAACFIAGPQLGEQQFQAEINYQGQRSTVNFSGTARIQPAISTNGVVDAASNTVDPARGLAPGSYAAIYGMGLSDASRLFSTPYLPVSLSGVSVSFDVPSAQISVPGRLTWVGPGQVNVQIPWELEGQTQVKMKVRLGSHTTAVYTLPLAAAAPQLYQYPLGSGDAAVQRANTTILLDRNNPALRGDWVTLYANGMGRVTNRPVTGEPTSGAAVPETLTKPTITIGGKVVPAGDVWSGMSPGSIGLYQINARIPDDAPTGQQPVQVTQGGVQARTVNIYIQ